MKKRNSLRYSLALNRSFSFIAIKSYDIFYFQVFKLYTGYNLQGHMTPVLVFLTDKTLYVTDLVRNRLCNKFVLPYTELDVILVGIRHLLTILLKTCSFNV